MIAHVNKRIESEHHIDKYCMSLVLRNKQALIALNMLNACWHFLYFTADTHFSDLFVFHLLNCYVAKTKNPINNVTNNTKYLL